jgi:hypothetical protein
MKNIFIVLTVLTAILSQNTFSQNTTKVMIGEIMYTGSKEIPLKPCEFMCNISIQILNNGKSGLLVFKLKSQLCSGDIFERVNGSTLLYLADNSIIKLEDSKRYDCVNKNVYSIYYLSPQNISLLKKKNIDAIRFSSGYGQGSNTSNLLYNKECELGRMGSPLPEGLMQEGGSIIKKMNYTAIFNELF